MFIYFTYLLILLSSYSSRLYYRQAVRKKKLANTNIFDRWCCTIDCCFNLFVVFIALINSINFPRLPLDNFKLRAFLNHTKYFFFFFLTQLLLLLCHKIFYFYCEILFANLIIFFIYFFFTVTRLREQWDDTSNCVMKRKSELVAMLGDSQRLLYFHIYINLRAIH